MKMVAKRVEKQGQSNIENILFVNGKWMKKYFNKDDETVHKNIPIDD